jgi:hypothetical protein
MDTFFLAHHDDFTARHGLPPDQRELSARAARAHELGGLVTTEQRRRSWRWGQGASRYVRIALAGALATASRRATR